MHWGIALPGHMIRKEVEGSIEQDKQEGERYSANLHPHLVEQNFAILHGMPPKST